METIHPSEFPHSLSLLRKYPHYFEIKPIWFVSILQPVICILSSISLFYLFYKKFYGNRELSWKIAMEILNPLSKRLKILDKERVIWSHYVEWVEDYYFLYYAMLNYLNTNILELDKLCKKQADSLKNCSESSIRTGRTQKISLKSLASSDRLLGDRDSQIMVNLTRVLRIGSSFRLGSGNVIDVNSSSAFSSEAPSTNDLDYEISKSHQDIVNTSDEEYLVEYIENLLQKNSKKSAECVKPPQETPEPQMIR